MPKRRSKEPAKYFSCDPRQLRLPDTDRLQVSPELARSRKARRPRPPREADLIFDDENREDPGRH
jgi:hypothetical protein